MPTDQTGNNRQSGAVEGLAALSGQYEVCLKLTLAFLKEEAWSEPDRLEAFLTRRARMLAQIDRLEKSLETRVEDGRTYLTGVENGDRARVEALIEELGGRTSLLADADRKLREKVVQALDETDTELKRIRKGRTALKGYAPYRGGIAYYIDRRG
ncbi:MAG: hypothetical protein KKB20_14805 [Proteobacteria bacterium]|nr:hypothetical protein [Pseudomonadota bacterium]